MRLVQATRIFASNAVWRGTTLRSAGRQVLNGLKSEDADVRTIAGMFLVKAGDQALPLLREALARATEESFELPLLLRVIGDLKAFEFEPQLRRCADSDREALASAARDALRLMAAPDRID